jgi:hypothetical protein
MPTAVISVREMLTDVIKADSIMAGLLSGKMVVTGKVEPNTALNYIELGATTETPEGAGYYHRAGHHGTEALHCWAKTRWTAQKIFARLSDLLDTQRPVLSGHVVMRGVLEYVTDGPDPEGKAWQVWARYRVRSLVEVA